MEEVAEESDGEVKKCTWRWWGIC